MADHEITIGDALVLCILSVSEYKVPYRALYDTGYIVKNPAEMVMAIDALIGLQEIVDEHYQKETDPVPAHDQGYYEAQDGGKDWREEGRDPTDPTDLR